MVTFVTYETHIQMGKNLKLDVSSKNRTHLKISNMNSKNMNIIFLIFLP